MTPLSSVTASLSASPYPESGRNGSCRSRSGRSRTASAELKASRAERFTIKELERTKKNLETKLQKLHDAARKDDVVTFEQLGVDRLYVDEAHSFKNLFLYTKMRNVAGLSTTDAQKSSDMLLKCRYIDEITHGKGVTFATGTPISNSMTELYTMMRYLQHDMLKRNSLTHFDCWASAFGETTTAIELAPGGDRLPGEDAVCQVLQPAGADEPVPGGGGHQDRRPAKPSHAYACLPQRGQHSPRRCKSRWCRSCPSAPQKFTRGAWTQARTICSRSPRTGASWASISAS